MRLVPTILFLSFLFNATAQTTPTAKELIGQVLKSIESLKTARYSLHKQERIGHKMVESDILVKLHVNPLKVYVYSVSPNPGAEVLYVKGENNNNVKVRTNSFPYVTLNLNIHNSLLRSNQHHTMSDVGFNYLLNVISGNIVKNPDQFYNSLSSEGLIDYKGRQYYKLIIDNKNYGYTTYQVKKGENVSSISEKLGVSDYMVLHLNPNLSDYNDVHPGQRIKVPNSYAKRIILYIDKITELPLVQLIYDEKGLFENYEMSSFVPNANLSPAEFTPEYKDYHF